MGWIQLVQNRAQWPAPVNTLLVLRVPWKTLFDPMGDYLLLKEEYVPWNYLVKSWREDEGVWWTLGGVQPYSISVPTFVWLRDESCTGTAVCILRGVQTSGPCIITHSSAASCKTPRSSSHICTFSNKTNTTQCAHSRDTASCLEDLGKISSSYSQSRFFLGPMFRIGGALHSRTHLWCGA
jgi:hypothetical protein